MAAEMSAKDNKINDLVEELGATQALLTEKEHALQEVTLCRHVLTGQCDILNIHFLQKLPPSTMALLPRELVELQ